MIVDLDQLQDWMDRYEGMHFSASRENGTWIVMLVQGKRVHDGRAIGIKEAVEIAMLKHEASWKMAK